MGPFAVSDVVLVAFPYADFSAFKKRPALVVAKAEFNNLILCQITSKAMTSKQAICITDNDFGRGSLQISSYVRPDKLFTVERSAIQGRVGSLRPKPFSRIKTSVRQLFK